MKEKIKNIRQNAGFTLIELLVVIAMAGGLLIALPSVR